MNTPNVITPWWRRAAFLVPAIAVILCLAAVRGVAGYFLPSAETATLRKSAVRCLGGEWHKKFAVHVGWFTTAAVRCGTHFFRIPPEARAGISSLRGADVGVYKLEREPRAADVARLFSEADSDMSRQGWERTVTVMKGKQLVAIYTAPRGLFNRQLGCALMVLKERDFVLVSIRGNPQPLLELAAAKELIPHREARGHGPNLGGLFESLSLN